jgi:pimeloyl-ACP methyl ester carboxylesterase
VKRAAAVKSTISSWQDPGGAAERPRIPFLLCGGTGTPLVFLHANGFPPECYQPLLQLLATGYRTRAMYLRPLWPEAGLEDLNDWNSLSGDLLRFLDEQGWDKVIAVGHSMGANAALRAALWSPERFAALALLEPVLVPRQLMLQWRVVRDLGLGERLHPLIPGALRRQREFPSLESAFERYRARTIFRYFTDESLRTYIAGMLTGTPAKGYRLVYSPEWEARIYETGVWNDSDLWRGMSGLRVPTLIVRGAQSTTLRQSTTREVEHRNAQVRIAVVERSTHLMPLERPQMVFDVIQPFLEQLTR